MKKERVYDTFTVIIIIVLILLSALSYGRVSTNTDTVILNSFNVKELSGKHYLNWLVQSSESDYYFVLEKSTNESPFELVDFIQGYKSPQNQALLFSKVLTAGEAKSVRYRLKAYKIEFELNNGEKCQIIDHTAPNLFEHVEHSVIRLGEISKKIFLVE